MVVFFFIALFGYNQIIRREMNQEMSMEVNKMVEHYVAMTEEKSRSNAAMDWLSNGLIDPSVDIRYKHLSKHIY